MKIEAIAKVVSELDKLATPGPWATSDKMGLINNYLHIVGSLGESVIGGSNYDSSLNAIDANMDIAVRYRWAAPELAREVLRLQ